MSILQDYEKIKKEIGEEKWQSIGRYIDECHSELRLDQIIYNPYNYVKFNNWFYEEIKFLKVDGLYIWDSVYDDMRCKVTLYKNGKEVANIIASYDEFDIRYQFGDKDLALDEDFVKENIKSLIYENFDNFLKLPKISDCSELLQTIYDIVCESDATMCHISENDWEESYSQYYSEKDIEILKEEIKIHDLEDVIGLDDGEYKIIGYGDLETRFNDDRKIDVEQNHNNDKVYIVCYDTLNIFESKEDAKKFYSECFYMSEGAEHERYASILTDLNFTNIAMDNISKDCGEIKMKSYEDRFLSIELEDYLSIDDTIKYFEEKIQPILEVSDEYGIDFNSKIPFEYFGTDSKSHTNYSFSNYYKDLLKKFGVNIDNIYTNDWSDGKYKLVINDNEVKLTAWDNLESVVGNVNSIVELLKNDLSIEI